MSRHIDEIMHKCMEILPLLNENTPIPNEELKQLRTMSDESYLTSDLNSWVWGRALEQIIHSDPRNGKVAGHNRNPFLFLIFRAFERYVEDLEDCAKILLFFPYFSRTRSGLRNANT